MMPSQDKDIFEKPYIIITSTGRTGTHFLGTKLSEMIEGCTSTHEPDVIRPSKPLLWPEKIRQLGLFNSTVGKFLVRHSVANLSVARVKGTLDDEEIVRCMRALRTRMLEKEKNAVLLEANAMLCGLVELLPRAFPNVRVAYIVRDPRGWVVSWMNRAVSPASVFNIRRWFKNTSLTPFDFEGDPYRDRWETMDVFERLCWWWAKRNTLAIEQAERIGAGVYRYEDLFGEATRDEWIPRLLKQITQFPGGFAARWQYRPELFGKRTNVALRTGFKGWESWEDETLYRFNEQCGALMERMGYGTEPEWQERISSL